MIIPQQPSTVEPSRLDFGSGQVFPFSGHSHSHVYTCWRSSSSLTPGQPRSEETLQENKTMGSLPFAYKYYKLLAATQESRLIDSGVFLKWNKGHWPRAALARDGSRFNFGQSSGSQGTSPRLFSCRDDTAAVDPTRRLFLLLSAHSFQVRSVAQQSRAACNKCHFSRSALICSLPPRA